MKRTILIVDDEYSARKMLYLHLDQLENYSVVAEAANGQSGLELFHSLKPDILITDIQMPIMNGLNLIEAVRKEKEDQIVIILSCYESFSYAQQAIRLGVQDYLVKDMITARDLEICLDRACTNLPAFSEIAVPNLHDISNVHGIHPHHAALIEEELQELSVCFFTWNRQNTISAIQKLYKAHVSGMAQYCFLQKVNSIVISWIVNECVQHNYPTEKILTDTPSPLSMLQSVQDPSIACELLCRWVGNLMEFKTTQSAVSDRIRQVIVYLNENYHKDLSLQNIADHFHIHKVYLSRSFKEETGNTLTSYLNYLRIEKAKLLLCMKTYRTNEIAYMVGFNNTQNFYNTFRKLVGCSPSDYMDSCKISTLTDCEVTHE